MIQRLDTEFHLSTVTKTLLDKINELVDTYNKLEEKFDNHTHMLGEEGWIGGPYVDV